MPEKMNALEEGLFIELSKAAAIAAQDEDVRCVVITGTGSAFCAGGDIDRFSLGFSLEEGVEYVRHFNPFCSEIVNMEKPVIAAVNGYALGAGFCLALLCDIIYASEDAKFGMAFRNVGLMPDFGGIYFLPRLIGLSKAKELAFTGRNISAAEAEHMGIVSRVFSRDEFEEGIAESANSIAAGPVFAMKQTKLLMNQSLHMSLDELFNAEAYAQGMCFQNWESSEGVRAFKEKRKPCFFWDENK